jgi:hypothetical protein
MALTEFTLRIYAARRRLQIKFHRRVRARRVCAEFAFTGRRRLLEKAVRKILFILGLWLGLALAVGRAETLTLTDGSTQAGDIVKFTDNGLLLRTGDNAYTNLPWARFSQASLKQLAANAKIRPLVEPFIEPDESQRPPKPEIKVGAVSRLELPANPSVFGGLATSSVGLFILLALYAANLYAAYEVAIIRARPAAQVMGLAAVLPVIGPIIFLSLPTKVEAPPEEAPAPDAAASEAPATPVAAQPSAEEIQIVSASWQASKQPEPQVFARGKFTFNKRFIETKFVAFFGAAQTDEAKDFTMEVKTGKEQIPVVRILQVAITEVVFEVAGRGPVTVPLSDIQEIKLIPKPA